MTTEHATPARSPLTARQAEVLAVVARHIRERGYAPTLRELCATLSIRSTNSVSDHLRALVRKGWLRHDAWKSRGLALVGASDAAPAPPRALTRATDASPDAPSPATASEASPQ
jgi:SOS-response transcriptional repressor LexA